MYKIEIDLSNGKTIEIVHEYIYSLKENLNDIKNPFIEIASSDGIINIIKKEDIISVKIEVLSI